MEQSSPPPVTSGNSFIQMDERNSGISFIPLPVILMDMVSHRLMAPDSVIQFVHKHMGLVPGWGGAARLVRIVGSQSALQLLSGALKVDPELGTQLRLTDGVLEADQDAGTRLEQAERWLSRYTKGAAPVIRAVKQVVLSGRELPLSDALRTEKDVFGTVWGGPANLQALASKSKHK